MAISAKISEKTREITEVLTAKTGMKQIDVIEEAVIYYLHFSRIKMLNDSFEVLRKDTKAWKEIEKERKALEGTLLDGLANE